MKRYAFIDKQAVEEEIKAGNLCVRFHPQHKKLAILNYTKQAQFSRHWTPITRRCRGLVVEWRTIGHKLPIVIDSPQKFFLNNEPEAPDLTQWKFKEIVLTEKLDGYYISIRYDSKYGLIITSRGSFDSKYVLAAEKLCPTILPPDIDFFCELCQNFAEDKGIIVTTHEQPELVCWGVGHTVPQIGNTCGWPGKIARSITQEEFKKYMSKDVEGIVAFNLRTHERVKVKTQWYLEMHRLITNCTFRNVFAIVSGGGTLINTQRTTFVGKDGQTCELSLADFPEEHLAQMRRWEMEIRDVREQVVSDVNKTLAMYSGKTRKEYALDNPSPNDIKSIVFARMGAEDDARVTSMVWNVTEKRLRSKTTD